MRTDLRLNRPLQLHRLGSIDPYGQLDLFLGVQEVVAKSQWLGQLVVAVAEGLEVGEGVGGQVIVFHQAVLCEDVDQGGVLRWECQREPQVEDEGLPSCYIVRNVLQCRVVIMVLVVVAVVIVVVVVVVVIVVVVVVVIVIVVVVLVLVVVVVIGSSRY